jgi:hypothetical protein
MLMTLKTGPTTSTQVAPTSYAINGSITYGDKQWTADPSSVRSRRFDEFGPRAFLFIEESDGSPAEQRRGTVSAFDCAHMTPEPKYFLSARHRGGGFVSCMDGHVEWFLAEDFKAGMDLLSGINDWYGKTYARPTSAPEGKESPEEVASRWNPS